jgi:hypothetical protein
VGREWSEDGHGREECCLEVQEVLLMVAVERRLTLQLCCNGQCELVVLLKGLVSLQDVDGRYGGLLSCIKVASVFALMFEFW